MKRLIPLLVAVLPLSAADTPKPLPKLEQAVRGTNSPVAAKQGEFPFAYGAPGKAVGNPHQGPPPYGKGPPATPPGQEKKTKP